VSGLASEVLRREVDALTLPEAWQVFVFEGGSYRPDLSRTVAAAMGERVVFGGPDASGVVLDVPNGAELPGPVQILEIAVGSSKLRHVIQLGSGARAKVLGTLGSPGDARSDADSAWKVELGAGAVLEHASLLRGHGLKAETTFEARLESGSRLVSRRFLMRSELSRTKVDVDLAGPDSSVELSGLVSLDGDRKADVEATVRHAAPPTTSEQVFQALAGGRSAATFVGKVIVEQGAKGTAARQSSRNILLSRTASIDSRPQLEIHDDDVKCSHGSATGRLDENAIRFLRSRGFSLEGARALLVRAFAGEQLEKLPEGGFRSLVEGMLDLPS